MQGKLCKIQTFMTGKIMYCESALRRKSLDSFKLANFPPSVFVTYFTVVKRQND